MSDWSIAYVGDWHCPAFNTSTIMGGMFDWLQTKINDGVFNIKVLATAGDLYEQTLLPFGEGYVPPGLSIANMKTKVTAVRDAGIMVVACDGNHDNDTQDVNYPATTFWNDVLPLSFFSSQSGYLGCMTPGDSSNLIMQYENSGVKTLFLTYNEHPGSGLDSSTSLNGDSHAAWYAPQTDWIKAQAALYPDHNVIVMGHFFINGKTRIPDFVAGPGSIWHGPGRQPFIGGITALPNLFLMLSGHDRSSRKCHYVFPCDDGHLAAISQFDTQGSSSVAGGGFSGNGAYINLITFRPTLGIVQFRTYDYTTGQFLTNQDGPTVANSGRFEIHNWQMPIAIPRRKLAFRLV